MPQSNTAKTCITALSTAVPKGKITQGKAALDASRVCGNNPRQAALIGHLFKRAGIKKRSVAIYDLDGESQESLTSSFYKGDPDKPHGPSTAERMSRYQQDSAVLAQQASQSVLQTSGLSPLQISHLVTVSCTGFAAPGFDLSIVHALALSTDISRSHLGFMGCHGAMNGLRIAKAYVEADPKNIVLVCAAELCSLHFQYDWEPNSIVANSLFADGAAALIVKQETGTDGLCKLEANASLIVDNTSDLITWQIGDHGFLMKLSHELPENICANLPGFMERFLAQHNLTVDAIQSWAIHPGGKRVLDAVQSCLKLSPDAMLPSRFVLSEYGNMSSPTVLFILRHLLDTQLKLPCVLLAFGPGLTIEAALLN